MCPPPCQGGICSSRWAFPYNAPIPVGPKTLCPEKTKKSASSAVTLTGRCGIDCAPSIRTGTPQECASAITCSTGLIVPSEFERCAKATNFVRGPNISANFSGYQFAAIVHRRHTDRRAHLLSEQLPG